MKELRKITGKNFDFNSNCFDLLRLLGVLYVMTQYILCRVLRTEVPFFDRWSGVVVLFCISGFLIPASMERSRGVGEFLKKRVLRVIPPLWICIIIGVLVAAAFCGFTMNITFVKWFIGQLCFIRGFTQPDFISAFGVGKFQSNLWMIVYTAQFYLITAIVYKAIKNRKIGVWIGVLVFSMALNIVTPYVQADVPVAVKNVISHTCLPFFYIYFAGWFIYRWRETIVPMLCRAKVLLALLIIGRGIWLMNGAPRVGEYYDMVMALLLIMLTIGVGYSFGKIRFSVNLSYGLYLYHMVVVDVLVHIGLTGNIGYVIAVYAVSAVLAFISYYLVDDTVARLFRSKPRAQTVIPPTAPPMPEPVGIAAKSDGESDF